MVTKFQLSCVLINHSFYVRADNIYLKLMFSCTTSVHKRNKNRIAVQQTGNISHCPSVVEEMSKFKYMLAKQNRELKDSIAPMFNNYQVWTDILGDNK